MSWENLQESKCKVGRVVCMRNSMEASVSGAAPQNQVGGTGMRPEREPRLTCRAPTWWRFGSLSECDEKSLTGLEQANGITQPLPQATYMYILVYKRQTSEKILNVSVQIYHHYFYTFVFYLNLKKNSSGIYCLPWGEFSFIPPQLTANFYAFLAN